MPRGPSASLTSCVKRISRRDAFRIDGLESFIGKRYRHLQPPLRLPAVTAPNRYATGLFASPGGPATKIRRILISSAAAMRPNIANGP
jgi:hypothetical protein